MTVFLLLAALQDVWLPTAVDGAPTPRRGHTAVWTGREMIVWGGEDDGGVVNDGAAYDPITAVWRPISAVGAPDAQTGHVAVWTGSEMIVWGTFGPVQGGRYNPATDTWTPITTTGDPVPGSIYGAVWTGVEMIVWGSSQSGGRYHPPTDSWTPTGMGPGLPTGLPSTFAWTGTRMIVLTTDTSSRYDPGTDTWAVMTSTGAPVFGTLEGVWTGSELIVMGSGPSSVPAAYRYDPVGDVWTTISGVPQGLIFHRVVWSGREAIGWGRHPFGGPAGNTFDPVANAWPAMATTGRPVNCRLHTLVWAGDAAIVWGGEDVWGIRTNTGGLYYPYGSGRGTSLDTGCVASTGTGDAVWIYGGLAMLGGAFLLRRGRRALTALALASLAGFASAQEPVKPAEAKPAQEPQSEKRDESKPIPPAPGQEPAPPPPVPEEEEAPALDSKPFLVVPSVGVWFNGLRFRAATPTGEVRLESGAMPALGMRAGFFVADPVFIQLSMEAALGSDAVAMTAGADVGLRFGLGEWGELPDVLWELDVYAGGLLSRLDVDDGAIGDFEAGAGFRGGAALRARLPHGLALEAAAEFRSLEYEWKGFGSGDDEARANGVALLFGLRLAF